MAELPFEPENTPAADLRSLPLGSQQGSMGASPAAGATSKLDQMIEQQMALRGTLKGGLYGFFSGLAGQDPNAQLNQLMQMRQSEQQLSMQGQQEQRAQQLFQGQLAAQQLAILNAGLEMADKVDAIGDDKAKAIFNPIIAKLMKVATGGGAIQTPQGREEFDMESAISGLSGKGRLRDFVQGMDDWSEDEKAIAARASRAGPEPFWKAVKGIEERKDQQARGDLLSQIPPIAARAREDGKTLSADQLLDGRLGKMSPRHSRIFQSLKPEDFKQLGILPVSEALITAERTAQTKGEPLTWTRVGVGEERAQTHLGSQGITPETFQAMTPEAKAVALKGAVEGVVGRDVTVAREKTKAEAAAKLESPVVQAAPHLRVIDKTTGEEIDRITTTIPELRAMGGKKRFAYLEEKEYEQYKSIRETKGIMGEYRRIAEGFTDQPGQNFEQALVYWAKTKVGIANPGVALAALEGTKLRLGKALQGSSQNLSNADVRAVENMLTSGWDTKQSGLQRIGQATRLLDIMEGTVLGTSTGTDLKAAIRALPTYQPEKGASDLPTVTGPITPRKPK